MPPPPHSWRSDLKSRLNRPLSFKGHWIPIRWKMLTLLALAALVPMTMMFLSELWLFNRLGHGLASRSEAVLEMRARAQLELLADTSSRLIRKERLVAEQAVQLQREVLEDSLSRRVHTADPDTYQVIDKDTTTPLIPNLPAFFIGNSANARQSLAEIPLLAQGLASLDLMRRETHPLIFRQYAATLSGLFLASPAQDLGWQPTFDPKSRVWFSTQPANHPQWSVTQQSLDNDDFVLTVFVPLLDDSGKVIGSTGIDIHPGRIINTGFLPPHWQETISIVLVRWDNQMPGVFEVLARQNQTGLQPAWIVDPEIKTIPFQDQAVFQKVIEQIQQGESGVAELPFAGEPSFFAFAPATGNSAALIISIPRATVVRDAENVQKYLWSRVQEQISTSLALVLIVSAGVVASALLCARAFTRPLENIIKTVSRLADGDFDARSNVKTQDERETLAEAVNALAPALKEHLDMKQSLQLANAVQQHLLPSGPLKADGVDLVGTAIYSAETGGDYFDYANLINADGSPSVGVVIGDVTGHGIASALLMATSRAVLRSEARRHSDIGSALANLNEQLIKDASGGQFLTLFTLHLNPATGRILWASAGHDPAIVYSSNQKTFRELTGGGLALGILAGKTYEVFSGQLEQDEWVVLGTDGIWEARRADGEMFGKDRLREVIATHCHGSAQDLLDAILSAVTTFRGDEEQQDDITAVVLRRTA